MQLVNKNHIHKPYVSFSQNTHRGTEIVAAVAMTTALSGETSNRLHIQKLVNRHKVYLETSMKRSLAQTDLQNSAY